MAAHDTTRPDLAELKRAALNKVAKLRASQAAPAPSSPSPSHGGFADGTTNDTVRLLIQEKNELLTALEEERARVARLESEAIASSTQVQEAGTADALKTLEEENKGLKAEMDILSSKLRGLEAAMQTAEVQRAAANDQLLDKEREWAAALADMETRTAQTLETLEQRLVDSGRHVEALGNESQGLKDNLAAARRERDEALERTSTLEKSVEMLETKVRNMTTREELAVTWKTKTERLVAENTRLLEERSELHSRLTELASANASLTLALDTAQRLLASRPDSPDLSPRLARRTAEDLPGREPEPRETLPSPPASVPDQVQPGELQDKLQALVEQNARLVEELAKEREISERLAAQVDEIPGFIVKFVEQRQRIGEPMTSSPTDEPEDRKFLENPGKASDVPPRVDSQQTAMATTAIMSDFTGDMMHCPICFEAQEVFL